MNFALPRPLWFPAFGWFAACVASVTFAAASMPAAGWESDGAAPAVAAEVAAPKSARCTSCGTVEAVRIVKAVGATPASYELTVRFRDGSRRLSSHADDAGWHAGDSIILIGGSRLADRT